MKWAKALGSIQFRGNLVADGRSGLSLREGKLELGTAKSFRLSLSGSVQDVLGGSGFEMDLDLQSTSPSATLSSLDLDWPPLDGLQGQAQLRGSLAVPGWEEVKVSVGLASGLKLEAQGRVDGRGDTLTAEFDLSLRAGNVRHLVESISDLSHDLGERIQSWVEATQQRPVAQHLLTLAPVEASAQIEGSENRWRLVKASGQAGSPDGEWLRVSGQAKVFWPELAGLELGAELHLPNLPEAWGPLVASARAKGSAAGWVLDPLDLKLDRGHVTGRGAWTQKDQAPHFELSLHSAQLDLRGPFAQKQEPESESETASSPPETEEEGPFSFEWLSGTQARIELSADRVLLGEAWNANDLEMSVRWADGQLEGPDLKLDWPEGGVRTRGRLDAVGAVPSLDFGLSAEGIDVEAVEAWLGQPSILTGQAQWTLDLKTRGHSRKEFLSNMGGGTIVYVQHGTVLDRYADAIELGIRLGSRAGKRPMNCLIAALLVNQGLIRTEALFWETPHKKLIGVGALDLTQQHMDLLLRPHLTSAIPTGVTAAIRIEGPLDDLRTRPEPLQTVADLTRGLFGRVLRAVRVVSPQLSDAVAGVGSTTDRMLVSTGLDVPSLLRVLAQP
ncbi:MAG: AsmA-like C-terminal region-containing protein, partial [Myxococcota bacterium]